MFKIFFTILLLIYTGFSAAGAQEEIKKIESEIISEISTALTGKKIGIKAYFTGNMKYITKYSKIFIPVKSCGDADVVIAGKHVDPELCRGKLMIVTRYYLLRKNKDAVAAFYWQKGRPNVIFIEENLKKFGITLPKKYYKYINSEKDL